MAIKRNNKLSRGEKQSREFAEGLKKSKKRTLKKRDLDLYYDHYKVTGYVKDR